MIAALIIGGVVCTALSMAGGFITDLKIGYWLGSSPIKQERWKFLGVLVSALTVGFVIMILNETYGFVGEGALVAPQANAMAAVIQPLMDQQPAPWTLYIVGAILALVLTMIKVPALAFALGMYIPLELKYSSFSWRFDSSLCFYKKQRRKIKYCKKRTRNINCLGIYCRWCFDGSYKCYSKMAGF